MRNHLKILKIFIVGLVLSFSIANSEDTELSRKWSLGIWAHYHLDFHTAEFERFPDVFSCNPGYSDVGGMGFSAGLLWEIPLTTWLYLDLRPGFYMRNVSFTALEEEFVNINGVSYDGVFEHSLDANLGAVGLEPTLGFRIWNGLALNLGPYVDFHVLKHYKQQEKVVSPSNGAFENGLQTRLYSEGDIPEMNPIGYGVVGRLSWEFPLNSRKTVWLAPEAAVSYGLSNLVNFQESSEFWNVSSIRVGFALKFSPSYDLHLNMDPGVREIDIKEYSICGNDVKYYCVPDSAEFGIDYQSEIGIQKYSYFIKYNNLLIAEGTTKAEQMPEKTVWKIVDDFPERLYNFDDTLTYTIEVVDKVGQVLQDSSYLVVNRSKADLTADVLLYDEKTNDKMEMLLVEGLKNETGNSTSKVTPQDGVFKTNASSLGNIQNWSLSLWDGDNKFYDTTGTGKAPDEIKLNLSNSVQAMSNESSEILYSFEIFDSLGHSCKSNKAIPITRKSYGLDLSYDTYGRQESDTISIDTKDPTIVIEEVISTRLQPLLNYVFFDDNSSVIPDRYVFLGSEDTKAFDINNFHDKHTLETYYNLMNIVGKRMHENPDANIVITGCNSNLGMEKENLKLSEKRAKNVYNYMKDVWNISESRMTLASRNLPEQPSSTRERVVQDYRDGIQENRRVEITSDNYAIVEPILSSGKRQFINPEKVFFLPQINSEKPLKSWKMPLSYNNTNILDTSGLTNYPDTIFFDVLSQKKLLTQLKPDHIKTMLTATNDLDLSAFSSGSIPVDYIQKSEGEGLDTTYDEYSLILFDFGSNKIGDNNQKIIDIIKAKVNPGAVIDVVGHTDRVGNDRINLRLSTARAKNTYKALNFDRSQYHTNSDGIGEEGLLYTNKLPEGRFYCRTVKILVANPVIKEADENLEKNKYDK